MLPYINLVIIVIDAENKVNVYSFILLNVTIH